MSGYEALVRLAERELDLARAGEVDALAATALEREALIAALPGPAPAAAGPLLRRAIELQTQIVDELARARDTAGRELGRLTRGRGAVRAYGHVGAGSPGAGRLA